MVVHVSWTLFPHIKDIYKRTWISSNGKDYNQIDHMIINGRWRNSPENVLAKQGADVGGDQQLLLAKVRLHLKETEQLNNDGTKLRFNFTKLKDSPLSQNVTTSNA